ncbi:MAG: hypothetical protein OXL41_13290 [Nitrospinae bacterium]|nr:hypothetical protein [Nitrospinota bacterium]
MSLDVTGRRIGAWSKAHRARETPRSVLTASLPFTALCAAALRTIRTKRSHRAGTPA